MQSSTEDAEAKDSLTPRELRKFFAYTMFMCKMKREPPVYGCEAFVHKMEGKNLRTWIKVSPNKLAIHIYYDSLRKCHRVICVDGTMPVINSTITPTMSISRTSAKFAQWLDAKSKVLVGLGFSCEGELSKFIDKFREIQESIECRSMSPVMEEKSNKSHDSISDTNGLSTMDVNQTISSLRYENERLKLALTQSAHNAKRWETELDTLRIQNQKLSRALELCALQEQKLLRVSNANEKDSDDSALKQQLEVVLANVDILKDQVDNHIVTNMGGSEILRKILALIAQNQKLLSSQLGNSISSTQTATELEHLRSEMKQIHDRMELKLVELNDLFSSFKIVLDRSSSISM